jgi:ankyrin repeat protein
MTRQLDFIDFLHARGANLNAPRANQARPIHLFNGDYHYRGWRDVPPEITTKPYEVLRHLISLGAEMDLNTACHLGDLDLVRAMVAQDPSLVNRCSPYITYYLGSGAPISNAASRGHVEIVRFLLAQGADPNLPEEGIAPRGHALYHAAAQGNYELAELLLAHGANPSCPVESSADGLSRAISNNDARMVALLETHGARRGLDICAYYGDIERARLVLEPDPGALRTAAEEGNLDFVEFLIAAYPELPTQVSVAAKTREITDLLFAHGMPATLPDWLGETALHRLARRGDTENAALFLDRGADLHAREDNDSSTPLALAAKHNQPAMVRFLLSRGALAQHPADPPWATPRAWAQRRGNREILDILDKNE